METPSVRVYNLDNAKISICRHFRDKASPEDVIKRAVIRSLHEPVFLTGSLENAIIQMDSKMPQRQFRRAGEQQ